MRRTPTQSNLLSSGRAPLRSFGRFRPWLALLVGLALAPDALAAGPSAPTASVPTPPKTSNVAPRQKTLAAVTTPKTATVVETPKAPGPETKRKRRRVRFGILGRSREITHSLSASRDTGALQMIIAPHPTLTGGGEFSFFSAAFSGLSLRLGFFGLIELESKGTLPHVKLIAGDVRFWRGVYGFSFAVSLDELAKRWLGAGSALEFTVSWRHESEHQTGDNNGVSPNEDYSGVPIIGNFVMPDVALRWRRGPISLITRVQWKIFTDERNYSHAPGVDLTLRWHLSRWAQPFVSFFGEYVFGKKDKRVPDHYLARGLLGVILPASFGHLSLFLSADIGHRKGLQVFTREATVGAGIRVALF